MVSKLEVEATSQARIAEVIRLRKTYMHWTNTRIAQEVHLTGAYIGLILAKAGLITAKDVMKTLPVLPTLQYTHISPDKFK